MLRSLELRWLARKDKYIRFPEVVFANIESGGIWIYPSKKEKLIGDRYYPLDLGIIVVNEEFGDEHEATIAHEWRHVWQYYNWGERGVHHPWGIEPHLSYREQIVNYFANDVRELDALLFEVKIAPRPHALQWYEWIVKRGEA